MEEKQEDGNTELSDNKIDEIYKLVLPSVAAAVRASGGLPADDQFDFCSTYSHFNDIMEVEGDRAIELMKRIYKHAGLRVLGLGNKASKDVDEQVEALVDANDQLTERIGYQFDELAGIRRPPAVELVTASTSTTGTSKPIVASWNKKTKSNSTPNSYRLLAARFVQRPQLKFEDVIDNSDKPFYPKLKDKPNAKVPLDQSLAITTPSEEATDQAAAPNPYRYEIDHLEYPSAQLDPVKEPTKPSPPSENSYTFIDTPEGLSKLIEDLTSAHEIAVDLEHHDYRSFQGFTCLMQISTRDQDYIIDTLALRSHLQQLNIIFTDPSKVKVFHGADSDIEWLQKDFSLYIVNMLDTYEASHVLDFSRHSLAYLLEHYCQVSADKQFQLADWRIRPLPEELLSYAQQDTHYLLYIYDRMKNDLLKRANGSDRLVKSALDRSALTCRKVYRKRELTEYSHMNLYERSRKSFNNRQLEALKRLYAWRHHLAQEEDDSVGYILPNHIMLKISEMLPRESSGILACCNPIPPLVQQNLPAIHSIVQETRQLTLSTSVPIRQQARKQNTKLTNFLSSLHDSPSDTTCSKVELIKPVETEPVMVENSTLPVAMAPKAAQTVSNKSKYSEIKSLFTRLLTNYEPVPFVDFTKIEAPPTSKEPLGKRSREEKPTENGSEPTKPGVPSTEDEPISKKAKITESDEVEAKPLKTQTKTKKKFIAPDPNFKPFEYPKQDMSEFKPDNKRVKKPKQKLKKPKRDFARNDSAPDNNKSLTFRKK